MMEIGLCVIGQVLLGAVGGVITNLWAADGLVVDPLKSTGSTIVSILGGILGGVLAFPAIVLGFIAAMV